MKKPIDEKGITMKRLTVILIALAILAGCSGLELKKAFNLVSWEPVCRHSAVMCAGVVGEQLQTRIMIGPSRPGKYHAQAQVLINGEWDWLEYEGRWCVLGYQENFEPLQSLTLKEAVAKWFGG